MSKTVQNSEPSVPPVYPQEYRLEPALRAGLGMGAKSDNYINAIGPVLELDGGLRYQHGQIHLGVSLFGSWQPLNAPMFLEKDSVDIKTVGGRFEIGAYLRTLDLSFHSFFSLGYSLYGASQRQLWDQNPVQVDASGAFRFEQGFGLCFLDDVLCTDLSLTSDTFSKPRIQDPPENPSVSEDNVLGWQLKFATDVFRY